MEGVMQTPATLGPMRERIAARDESEQAHLQTLVRTNTLLVDDPPPPPPFFRARFLAACPRARPAAARSFPTEVFAPRPRCRGNRSTPPPASPISGVRAAAGSSSA